jgi:acetylornithine deacetylase/succinyl-diaminopimelate desuccinylase-like protein
MKTRYLILIALLTVFNVICLRAQEETSVRTHTRSSLEELREFIALPNDALNPEDIEKNLLWLNIAFEKRGFSTQRISTTNLPLFFAELYTSEDLPTILFYMHFDGQSVAPEKWEQEDPYEMVLKEYAGESWKKMNWAALEGEVDLDWRVFGRSVSDDKGPIVMFLHAVDMIREAQQGLAFNVKVILDSEEEKSSKPLPAAVLENKALLRADFLVINDGPVHYSGLPTLVYGCRGITSMQITTYGPVRPQHSGHYGNYAPNPGFRLAQLLSEMKDEEGRVLIEGYYDGISLDDQTMEIMRNVPDDLSSIHEMLEIASADKVGDFYQEALQYPSLNIRGMSSGWVGDKARTIVPESATAELDLRLVVESDGDRLKGLVKDFIASKGYYLTGEEPGKELRMQYPLIAKVKEGSVTDAFRTDLKNPYGIWLQSVLKDAFKEDVVQIRTMGGTVPIAPFVNALEIPAFILPVVNPDNNQHSPNENLKISQVEYGLKVFYQMLTSPYPKG